MKLALVLLAIMAVFAIHSANANNATDSPVVKPPTDKKLKPIQCYHCSSASDAQPEQKCPTEPDTNHPTYKGKVGDTQEDCKVCSYNKDNNIHSCLGAFPDGTQEGCGNKMSKQDGGTKEMCYCIQNGCNFNLKTLEESLKSGNATGSSIIPVPSVVLLTAAPILTLAASMLLKTDY